MVTTQDFQLANRSGLRVCHTESRTASRARARRTRGWARHPWRTRILTAERLEQRELLAFEPTSVLGLGGLQHDGGQAVAVDVAGNIYLTGGFQGRVDFDPGPAVRELDAGSDADTFVAKYDSAGNLDWVQAFDAAASRTSADVEYDKYRIEVAVDAAGDTSVYVLASYGSTWRELYTPYIERGSLMMRLRGSDGSRMWSLGEPEWSDATHYHFVPVASDFVLVNSSIFLVGFFTGTQEFGAGNQLPVSPRSVSDLPHGFISEVDTESGAFRGTSQTTVTGYDRIHGIAWESGSLYLTGTYSGTVTIGSTKLPKVQHRTAFAAKADRNRDFAWAKAIAIQSPNQDSEGWDIAAAGDGVFVTGYFNGPTATFGNFTIANSSSGKKSCPWLGYDIFVTQLDVNGTVQWAVGAGGPVTGCSTQLLTEEYPTAIVADHSGNVFVAGGVNSAQVQFGNTRLNNAGGTDGFVTQLKAQKSDQQFFQTWLVGGTGKDVVNGLTIDSAGNLWATGTYAGTVTFPDGTTLTSNSQSNDVFRLRFSPSVTAPAAMRAQPESNRTVLSPANVDRCMIASSGYAAEESFATKVLRRHARQERPLRVCVAGMQADGLTPDHALSRLF